MDSTEKKILVANNMRSMDQRARYTEVNNGYELMLQLTRRRWYSNKNKPLSIKVRMELIKLFTQF